MRNEIIEMFLVDTIAPVSESLVHTKEADSYVLKLDSAEQYEAML